MVRLLSGNNKEIGVQININAIHSLWTIASDDDIDVNSKLSLCKIINIWLEMVLISAFANQNFIIPDLRSISHDTNKRSKFNTVLNKWKKPGSKVYIVYNSIYMT